MTLRELFEAELASLDRVLQWITDEEVRDAIADERAELQGFLARWRTHQGPSSHSALTP